MVDIKQKSFRPFRVTSSDMRDVEASATNEDTKVAVEIFVDRAFNIEQYVTAVPRTVWMLSSSC